MIADASAVPLLREGAVVELEVADADLFTRLPTKK